MLEMGVIDVLVGLFVVVVVVVVVVGFVFNGNAGDLKYPMTSHVGLSKCVMVSEWRRVGLCLGRMGWMEQRGGGGDTDVIV